ncbi:hypothetical protein ACFU7Y_13400 [Kitasatospora sp. NPDC057542]|uniref:hypothetical protein n=1 Tax=Kitasatospora sp. NPDC057542 TaxID=3346162 RepID=UPI0036A4CB10
MTRKQRWVLLLAIVAPLALVGAAVGGLYWLREWDRHPAPDSGRPGSWMTVTSEFVMEFSRVRPPASAGEVHWAYQKGFQDDSAYLSFRLPPGEEERFLADLKMTVKPSFENRVDSSALTGFQRAGAPDPKAAGPLREGSFLAEPLPGHNKRLAATVWLAAEADGGTRVWVDAGDSP